MVKLTRELNLNNKQFKKLEEQFKKKEKENDELLKQIEVKNKALEKLRNEVTELSMVINSDKFKSIRSLESELRKYKIQSKEYEQQLSHLKTIDEHHWEDLLWRNRDTYKLLFWEYQIRICEEEIVL